MKHFLILIIFPFYSIYSQPYIAYNKIFNENLINTQSQWIDIDLDRDLDICISGFDFRGMEKIILYKNINNNFIADTFQFPELTNYRFKWDDFNNDHQLELILSGTDTNNNSVLLHYNPSNLSALKWSKIDYDKHISKIICTDINQDGWMDILLSSNENNQKDIINILENHHNSFKIITIESFVQKILNIHINDLNNDHYKDIMIHGIDQYNNEVIQIMKGDSNLIFHKVHINLFGSLRNINFQCINYNNDTLIDMIITGINKHNIPENYIYTNRGNLLFNKEKILNDHNIENFVATDINNDNISDICLYEIQNNQYILYYLLHDKNQFNDISYSYFATLQNQQMEWVDIDLDGDLDFVTYGTDFQDNIINLLYINQLNSNTNNFTPPNALHCELNDTKVKLFWQDEPGYSYELIVYDNNDSCQSLHSNYNNLNQKQIIHSTQEVNIKKYHVYNNLNHGKYYWRVIKWNKNKTLHIKSAIDSFIICPKENELKNISLCENELYTQEITKAKNDFIWINNNNSNTVITNYQNKKIISSNSNDTIIIHNKNTSNNCLETIDTIIINIYSSPIKKQISISKEICIDELISINIDSLHQKNSLYFWIKEEDTTFSTDPYFSENILKDTKIDCILKNNKCTYPIGNFTFTSKPKPLINIEGPMYGKESMSYEFIANGAELYTWKVNAEYINHSDSILSLTFDKSSELTLIGEKNGCKDSLIHKITISPSIFIPELITPNEDNLNEDLVIYQTKYHHINLMIYNINGDLCYENTLDRNKHTVSNSIFTKEGVYFWEYVAYNHLNHPITTKQGTLTVIK